MNSKYHIKTAWKLCIGNIVSVIILTLVVAAVLFYTFIEQVSSIFKSFLIMLFFQHKVNPITGV